MARKFEALRASMTPQAQARAHEKARKMLEEMPLDELRQARGLSQQMLATLLHVQQPAIAKLERRTDMYISTLRSHIQAMGGELEITARYPEGAVRILNFSDSGKPAVLAAINALVKGGPADGFVSDLRNVDARALPELKAS